MKEIDVIYKGEVLKLTRFWGNNKLCLWIKTAEELKEIKTIDGKVLNFEEL